MLSLQCDVSSAGHSGSEQPQIYGIALLLVWVKHQNSQYTNSALKIGMAYGGQCCWHCVILCVCLQNL